MKAIKFLVAAVFACGVSTVYAKSCGISKATYSGIGSMPSEYVSYFEGNYVDMRNEAGQKTGKKTYNGGVLIDASGLSSSDKVVVKVDGNAKTYKVKDDFDSNQYKYIYKDSPSVDIEVKSIKEKPYNNSDTYDCPSKVVDSATSGKLYILELSL